MSDDAGEQPLDAIIIGAGFGGMHMLYRLRAMGMRVLSIEAASDVGGAWFWNRYPGARCDVESLAYSYTFSSELDAEWRWSERYAAQPEIQAYLHFASVRLDLRRDIRFNTRVVSAHFDSETSLWAIECEDGTTYRCCFCIMATGPISVPTLPEIPGIDTFEGELFHTARWPQQETNLAGKRIGVVGTGSSGTQLIPVAAQLAKRLTVFLRTPNFTVPARNGPLDEDHYGAWISNRSNIRAAMWRGEIAGAGDVHMPEDLRMTRVTPASDFTAEQRQDVMERRWEIGGAVLQGSFKDVMISEAVNEEVADFVRSKIRAVVKDPKKAELLTPRGYALGTKRLCVGTDYYETFNRDNVEIVDVKSEPISRITPTGIVVGDREIPLDILIFATGFDALTGALTDMDVRGEDGQSIHQTWADGPHTYLGLMIAGFPNMFMIGGPGSPSVFSNVVMTNEYQVDFIADLLLTMREHDETIVNVSMESQDRWTDRVNEIVKHTLLAKAKSWYVGSNIPGKPRAILAFTGGVAMYRGLCEAIKAKDFEGFDRSRPGKQGTSPLFTSEGVGRKMAP